MTSYLVTKVKKMVTMRSNAAAWAIASLVATVFLSPSGPAETVQVRATCLNDVIACLSGCVGINRSIALDHRAATFGLDNSGIAADTTFQDYGVFVYSSAHDGYWFYNMTGTSANARCLNIVTCELTDEFARFIGVALQIPGGSASPEDARLAAARLVDDCNGL